MRNPRNLKALLFGTAIIAAGCGQSPINSSDDSAPVVGTEEQDLDGDGRPDQFDNCPNDPNPGDPLLWDGDTIPCAVPQNGLSQEDPDHWYVNGDPRPEVCDGQDNCAPEALYCVNGVIVIQPNADHDAQGDVCDTNDDNDNFPDEVDLCQFTSSPDNGDNDEDGAGDACDDDDDNDGVPDMCPEGSPEGCMADNCQFDANVDQSDMDFDGDGDACDEFMDCAGDEDGIPDAPGACLPPDAPPVDPSSMDSDSDGETDDTDCDSGNPLRSHLRSESCDDGVDNDCDLQTDLMDDDCNPDIDGDEVPTACAEGDLECVADNCPMNANGDQADMDEDGAGDACDEVDNRLCENGGDVCAEGWICLNGGCEADSDGDGVGNGDNCPDMANADQADMDMDGIGDPCDLENGLLCINGGNACDEGMVCLNDQCVMDSDGDGAADVQDNCPVTANGDQADADMDGTGDECDVCVNDVGGLNACNECGAVPAEACGDMVDNDCDGALNEGCDTDGDGDSDDVDNCPAVANASQMDRDADGTGDACDADCIVRLRTVAGAHFDYTLSSVVDNGYPVGPWDQSGDTEICMVDGETILFIALNGEVYALSGNCQDPTEDLSLFEVGYSPANYPGVFAKVCTDNGPDYLGTAHAPN